VGDGFNSKEIAFLKNRVERDATTYQAILIGLRKRFIGCIFYWLCLFILVGVILLEKNLVYYQPL